jgi:N-acyl-D-amino-acid deacylase
LKQKGFIKQGYSADLVVFDPQNIAAPEDYKKTDRVPQGLSYTILNGKIVTEKGDVLNTRAGQLIRS